MILRQPANTAKYDVKSSDTLSCIALKFNTTPSELSRLNHLSSTLLYPGQTLFVPDNAAGSPPTEHHQIPLRHATNTTITTTASTKGKVKHTNTTSPAFQNKTVKSKSFSYAPRSPDKLLSGRHPTLSSLDESLESLLQRHDSEEEISKRFLRIKTRYITDGQGVVSGVLLVTPQTIMFNPSVSDHLVMERGRDAYLVKLPLKALSTLTVFEEIAAMVTDDLTKQYIPNYENFQTFSPPKPGHIVCQGTGEEYSIHEATTSSSHVNETTIVGPERNSNNKTGTLLELAQEKLDKIRMEEADTTLLGSSESPPVTTTYKDSNNSGDDTLQHEATSVSRDQGIGTTYNSDTTCDNTLVTSTNEEPSCTTNNEVFKYEDPTTDVLLKNDGDEHFSIEAVQSSSTPKHAVYPSSSSDQATTNNDNVDESSTTLDSSSKYNKKPDLQLNLKQGEVSGSRDCTSKPTTALQTFGEDDNTTKDSGISDMTHASNSTTESMSPGSVGDKQDRSSLSDEAKKWLGKHSVSSNGNVSSPEIERSPDIEPDPATEFQDPLIYISIRVSKRYWCPILAKHNAIMGIPPNRDQKRRQHWFAIPREKVDQFYGFVMHWLPELNYSGLSTPSSECGNNELEEGLNIVDDTFSESPATRFGWEKLNREDAESMKKMRVDSIQSISSKLSLRSLDDEPETSCESELLTKEQLKYLVRGLPSVTVGHFMELVYSTVVHGISLKTLYRNFESFDSPTLVIVRDENHRAFGAFLSHPPGISDGFYGTGECQLYSFITEKKLKTYKWSGENSFFIKGSNTSLTVGGGEGVLGLWLDEDLYHGRTHACSTFNNEVLSENEDFICTGLEAWSFV